MRRTRPSHSDRKASAIFTADLHLTEATPVSRTDDYLAAQERKLAFLGKLSESNGYCPILCAGDLFDRWKTSPWFTAWVYSHLPAPFICIPGNHDLPMHSMEEYPKSAMSLLDLVFDDDDFKVLRNDSILTSDLLVVGVPFGQLDGFKPEDSPKTSHRTILLLHEMVWKDRKPTWAAGSYTAEDILDRFEGCFDVILVGDNHESFVAQRKNGPLLVNPGSMLRRTADQADFRPRCFLYYAETNKVIPVEFPIDEGVHNREHLDRKKEHDKRTAAYIERMVSNWKGGLSFKENLQAFFEANKIPRKVRELIWQHLEAEET